MSDSAPATLRADKWLWYARFFKSRSRAADVVTGGHLRINSERAKKASVPVRAGDTLTFPQGKTIRVVRVLALGERRGPASEARLLYDDQTPATAPDPSAPKPVAGKPDSKSRRAARKTKSMPLE
ncbi:RNA-binding S4 domain-containing protein [Qingshengfaniella alkalisoli]|uniref:RNA-binding S4 domain-containing protein n=1 Tax=Qingshengfaniella alkalisoli TaxID=2599296 RepID=A0A5B8ISR1_9RHOB|nr:RNA-binding S4 domain-containing protein [Qingshengfaniella alkalisoli]QDY69262.1 RNA-binding S4 domain-containing protein [Qingshengfaniella alkalisoli]